MNAQNPVQKHTNLLTLVVLIPYNYLVADLAQLVELLICNQWVGSSSLSIGTKFMYINNLLCSITKNRFKAVFCVLTTEKPIFR